MNAEWFAKEIAEVYMEAPVHPTNVGYTKFDAELLEVLSTTPEEIMLELQVQAADRGFDYEFKHIEDYDVESNTTDHIIEWRQRPEVKTD